MSRKFKAAIFDFDGVVADSEPFRMNTYEILFHKEFQVDLNLEITDVIGHTQAENLKRFAEQHGIRTNMKVLAEKRKKLLMKMARQGVPAVGAVHGIIFKLISKQIPMGIASNSSYDYIEAILKHFPLAYDFPIFSGDRIEKPKPHPDLFLAAAKTLRVPAKDCLVFEDTPVGIQAAKNAGMTSVGVLSSFSKEDLKGADIFLDPDSFEDTLKILEIF